MYAYSFILTFQMMYFTKEWLEAREVRIFLEVATLVSKKYSIGNKLNHFTRMSHPVENEADYLFVIRNNKDVNSIIEEIVHLAKILSLPKIKEFKIT